MSRKRDPETGQYEQKASDEAILDWMAAQDAPVVTATEIGDAFDIDRATAKRRLDALLDAGRVGRKEVGARAVVWWPVESNE